MVYFCNELLDWIVLLVFRLLTKALINGAVWYRLILKFAFLRYWDQASLFNLELIKGVNCKREERHYQVALVVLTSFLRANY